MADMELRTNSLRLRFERGDPEPTDMDIFSFMKEKMALKCDSLLSMYKEKNEMSVIIKFKKEEDAQRALMRLPSVMEFHYNKYQSANVKLSMANAIVRYIRLFNLPPEVEDLEIQKVMAKYGKVIRMVREKYAEDTGFPIWTSVRGVYVELKDNVEIPGTVLVKNLRARIFYDGLVNKCYRCGSTDHIKAECPQRKTVNDRLQAAGPSSYSDALTAGGRWTKKREPARTNEDVGSTATHSGENQNVQLHFTSLPVAANYHAPPSDHSTKAKEKVERQTIPGGTMTLSQRQAMQSEERISERSSENTTTTTNDQPCVPTTSTCGGGVERGDGDTQRSESETPSVPNTAAGEQWKVKTKRGRKQAGKEKGRKDSESEHSTTESDHQIDSNRQSGCGAKGVTTRNKARQQKRCKVGEVSGVLDASQFSESSSQVETMEEMVARVVEH